MDKNKISTYADAEQLTERMIYLTRNSMMPNTLSSELSSFAKNLIRIMNLDVEERMEIIDLPTGKKLMILFAKNTEYGRYSAYKTERVIYENNKVDIVVLPNEPLLMEISNPEILQCLDMVFAFILETQKASAQYISPMEIFKHVYARYFFKLKYFAGTFDLDEQTVNDLKTDIEKGSDGLLSYDRIIEKIKDNVSVTELFDQDEVLSELDTEIYYRIIDELSGEFDEEEEEE